MDSLLLLIATFGSFGRHVLLMLEPPARLEGERGSSTGASNQKGGGWPDSCLKCCQQKHRGCC